MPLNAAGLVYGTILVATLLSAESARRETYAKTVAAVAVTLVAYWLTLAYSEYAGERLRTGARFEYRELWSTARHELAVLYGAALPLVVLLGFWAAGARLTTAVSVDIWFAAALIVVAEIVSGVRADLRGSDLARQTAVGAVLGLLVIAVRVLLH